MLPALGNDLISLMKDTSLVSILAVREITQMARLYSGSSFRFRESFFILVVLYVSLTLSLSLLLRWYERRIAIPT
jgi:polar amino acid transport system permease protein